MPIVGPDGLERTLECLSSVSSYSTDELFEIVEAKPDVILRRHGQAHLEAVQVTVTPGETSYASMLYETPLPGHVNAERAKQLGIHGSDFASLVAGNTVRGVRPADVVVPARRGRRVVLTGRGRASEKLRVALQNSDVAVFATPFYRRQARGRRGGGLPN